MHSVKIMQEETERGSKAMIWISYFVCYVARLIEYFGIRTDKTIIGEAFLHKIFGMIVLAIVLKVVHMSYEETGFSRKEIGKRILLGLGFGLIIFVIGYGIEIAILLSSGSFQSVQFYVSSYAVDANIATGTSIGLLLVCVIGNMINVLMEEGVFRGLFLNLAERKMQFIPAALLSSVLFGFWHMVGPVRNYVDGISSPGSTIANIIMLVVTSGLVGFMFCLMRELTGSLYMGMAAHFVNNTITNLLHVVTKTGVDEMMFVRITIAQTVSFFIVLAIYLKRRESH